MSFLDSVEAIKINSELTSFILSGQACVSAARALRARWGEINTITCFLNLAQDYFTPM